MRTARPLCVGTIQGYWGLDRLPPSPLASDDPLTLPSPLYTRGALSMDICFDGPPAACCVGTSCVEVNQPIDCENMGGVFTRGGVHCPGPGDPTLCPLPEGACCFGAESCDYTTEYRCEDDLAGLWEENRDCAPFNPCGPPISAQRAVDGDCIDDLSDTECQAIDGIYRGDFTLCVNEAASCQARCVLPARRTCEIRVEGEMPGQVPREPGTSLQR